MEINIENREGTVIVAPSGDVDLSNSRELQTQLKRAMDNRPSRLVVNLGKVPYMDSSGVATLVEAMQIARKQKTDLVLCELQDKVTSIFEIARLDRVFQIKPDVDSALNA